MFQVSKEANENYLAIVATLDAPIKHPNADKLQIFKINYQQVVTNLDYKEGDKVVFFPVGSAINPGLVKSFNGFENKELNDDPTVKGYFDKNGRVRAIRLRGEQVEGFILPIDVIATYIGISDDEFNDVSEFDSYGNLILVTKYIPKTRNQGTNLGSGNKKKEHTLKSMQIAGQFRFHEKTPNLKNNIRTLDLYGNRNIAISYKLHGTSAVFSNVLVKKKLTRIDKILQFFKYPTQTVEYQKMYASRQVIKGTIEKENTSNQSYYSDNVWKHVFDQIKDKLPKGYTLYGEICGYTSTGQYIQKGYDYGIPFGESHFFVYRITQTNPSGTVIELTMPQILQFCEKHELSVVPIFYMGGLQQFIVENGISGPDQVIPSLSAKYNIESDCFLCKNKVPTEGIVLKVDDLNEFIAFKLKSFNFTQEESKEEESNIEDNN